MLLLLFFTIEVRFPARNVGFFFYNNDDELIALPFNLTKMVRNVRKKEKNQKDLLTLP